MPMRIHLKALAAAVGLSLGLSAQAAIIDTDSVASGPGAGAGTGNLVLAMFDAAHTRSLVFNTGLTTSFFNLQANHSFAAAIAAADKVALQSFVNTAGNALKWNIAALDNEVGANSELNLLGFQTTSSNSKPITGANGPTDINGVLGAQSLIANFFSLQNSSTGQPLSHGSNVVVTTNPTLPTYFAAGNYDGNLVASINDSGDNTGLLGESLGYGMYSANIAFVPYAGKWKLSNDVGGVALNYTVPVATVPVPPALVLLGSAVTGLVAIRRRKAA